MKFIEALEKAKEISKSKINSSTYHSTSIGLSLDDIDMEIEVDEMGNVFYSGGIIGNIEDFEKNTWNVIEE